MKGHHAAKFSVFTLIFAALLVSNNALADCVSKDDCDGDGQLNAVDPCPSLAVPGGTDADYHKGFQSLACFGDLIKSSIGAAPGNILFDPSCLPVAARRIEDTIPVDSLLISKGSQTVRGIVYVGIATSPDVIVALSPATADQVMAGFASGVLPNDTLFACMGSITFNGKQEVDNPVSVYGYKASASYVHAVFFSSDTTGYKPDGFGLFRKIRLNQMGWKPGFAGTNGTIWDDSLWSTNSAALSAGWPSAISSYVDGACYDTLVGPINNPIISVLLKDDLKVITASKDHDFKPWSILPDPGPGDTSSWISDFNTQKEFEVSDSGQSIAARQSVFGTRPLMSNFEAFQAPLNKSLKLPKDKPTASPKPSVPPKPGPQKPPKFGDGQFNDGGSVNGFDWGQSVKNLDICKAAPQDDPQKCCTTATDALVFGEIKDNPVFSNKHEFGGAYSDFFDLLTSYAQSRAIDDWAENVGGDLVIASALAKIKAQSFAPQWPMTKALPPEALEFGSGPSCKQLDVPDLQGGIWVRSSGQEKNTGKIYDWFFLSGTAYSAISPAGLGIIDRGIADIWHTLSPDGNTHAVSAKVALAPCYQSFSKFTKKWYSPPDITIPGEVDFVELDVPESVWSGTQHLDFTDPARTDLIASWHRKASQWYPGEDQWDTNYPVDAVKAAKRVLPGFVGVGVGSSQIQPNPANLVATTLLQNEPAPNGNIAKFVTDYGARVNECQNGKFKVYDADHHWPAYSSPAPDSRVVLAGLYGHQQPDPPGKHLPQVGFPSGDLVGPGTLHEGLDLNWDFGREYIEPVEGAWNLVESSVVPTPYCYGQLIFTGSYEVAIPCDDSSMLYCGDDLLTSDKGCSPSDLVKKEIAAACDPSNCLDSCFSSCSGWFKYVCDVACVPFCVGDWAAECSTKIESVQFTPLVILGEGICVGLGYANCGDESLRLFKRKRDDSFSSLDVELEHRILMGKRDGDGVCDGGYQCDYNSYVRLNETHFGDNGEFQVSEDLLPIGSGNQGKIKSENVYPFTFAPGLTWPRTQIQAGMCDADPSKLAVGIDDYQRQITDPTNATSAIPDNAFRVEFAGDFILDCGHEPIHQEIHPATAMMMHLSSPLLHDMSDPPLPVTNKRYSLFGYLRPGDQPPIFDLWPGPRPKSGNKLTFTILAPNTDTPINDLSCQLFPPGNPNRVRCTIDPSDLALGNCPENPRMLPGCSIGSGGGLVEVAWK